MPNLMHNPYRAPTADIRPQAETRAKAIAFVCGSLLLIRLIQFVVMLGWVPFVAAAWEIPPVRIGWFAFAGLCALRALCECVYGAWELWQDAESNQV